MLPQAVSLGMSDADEPLKVTLTPLFAVHVLTNC